MVRYDRLERKLQMAEKLNKNYVSLQKKELENLLNEIKELHSMISTLKDSATKQRLERDHRYIKQSINRIVANGGSF